MADPTKAEAQAGLDVAGKFVAAQGAAPPPTPPPTPPPAYPAWVERQPYAAGAIVRYTDGKLYLAKFANPGFNPTVSTYYWAPYSEPAAPAPNPVPPPASALAVAPYFQSWGNDQLTAARQASGLGHAVLAFGVVQGANFGAEFLDNLADGKTFMAAGGELTLSFGGQNGVYAEQGITDEGALFALFDKTIAAAGTRRIDFDVEGAHINDAASIARLNRLLVRLQGKYPDLFTSFTLPCWFGGLSAPALALLKAAIAAGVQIRLVNAMAMNFGAQNVSTLQPPTMATAVITTLDSAVKQVQALYPAKSPAQIAAMMGICPLIGDNADGTIFTLDNARAVAAHARARGISRITYWSYQRDRAQATPNPNISAYSGVVQADYAYLRAFGGTP